MNGRAGDRLNLRYYTRKKTSQFLGKFKYLFEYNYALATTAFLSFL